MKIFDKVTVPLFVVVFVTSLAWDGFVISHLWNWFVVPTFQLPGLSVLKAIGVNLAVCAFLSPSDLDSDLDYSQALWALRTQPATASGRVCSSLVLVVDKLVTVW